MKMKTRYFVVKVTPFTVFGGIPHWWFIFITVLIMIIDESIFTRTEHRWLQCGKALKIWIKYWCNIRVINVYDVPCNVDASLMLLITTPLRTSLLTMCSGLGRTKLDATFTTFEYLFIEFIHHLRTVWDRSRNKQWADAIHVRITYTEDPDKMKNDRFGHAT